MHAVRNVIILVILCVSGCATSLVRGGLSMSSDRWDVSLVKLAAGPDQYLTAGGVKVPRNGRRYVWGTVRIRNALKTDQVFRLDRFYLHHGKKRIKPCVIDMNAFVSMRAPAAPKLRPGETVTRRMAYAMPPGNLPERLTYENWEIIIPAGR